LTKTPKIDKIRRKMWSYITSIPGIKVARFLLVQNTKTGKNIPNYHKMYQMTIKYFQLP
jgi:hypothetical protein